MNTSTRIFSDPEERPASARPESIVVTDSRVYVGDPGPLWGGSKITLHTRQGRNLVMGRPAQEGGAGAKAYRIKGLFDYARQVRQVAHYASMDDPYADWTLLKLEAAYKETEGWLKHTRQELEGKLAAFRGVDIRVAQSVTPIEVSVEFQNPYAYLPIYLIADADQLYLTILTAAHAARISRDQKEKLMREVSAKIRAFIYAPDEWRFFGALVSRTVVRRGVDDETQHPRIRKALADASQRMGELPQEVLDRTVRGEFAPDIRKPMVFQEDEEQ